MGPKNSSLRGFFNCNNCFLSGLENGKKDLTLLKLRGINRFFGFRTRQIMGKTEYSFLFSGLQESKNI